MRVLLKFHVPKSSCWPGWACIPSRHIHKAEKKTYTHNWPHGSTESSALTSTHISTDSAHIDMNSTGSLILLLPCCWSGLRFTSSHIHAQCQSLQTPALDAQTVHLLASRPQSPQLVGIWTYGPWRLLVPPQQPAVRPLLLLTGWSSSKLTSVHPQRLRTETAHTQETVRNKINKLGQTEVIKSRAQSHKSTKQTPIWLDPFISFSLHFPTFVHLQPTLITPFFCLRSFP